MDLCGQVQVHKAVSGISSFCLCFALNTKEQELSRFYYQYMCYQIEYSQNLLFHSGTKLDSVYQELIDRTRPLLDLDKLKTIFGRSIVLINR
jgi:hypothetical protein